MRDERSPVFELLAACNAAEGIDIPLFLGAGAQSETAETSWGWTEAGRLTGFAFLPDDPEPEAILFVHPEARRRGIGRALLDAVRNEAHRRGLGRFLIVSDAASPSARGFLTAVGARYDSSEFRLVLDPDKVEHSARRHAELTLRPAGPDRTDTLARVQAAAFGRSEAETRFAIERAFGEGRRYFLGVLGEEPIGLLRIGIHENEANITAFGVLPELRGLGYGRQMLRDAVDLLLAEERPLITIEVATDNERALGLYRSCGFEVVSRYDFHVLLV